jgi:hypothetical protein
MNKYIKTDIEQGLKYLKTGIMNALADIESGKEDEIILGDYVPFSLVVHCARQRGWTDDENQSCDDWTNGWEIDCWWYMYTPDGRKNVCIESCLWEGQQTTLRVNHDND